MSLEKSNPDEEGVKVGEDIPLDREDGGEVGEEQEQGDSCQEGGQEDQQTGEYCTQLHHEIRQEQFWITHFESINCSKHRLQYYQSSILSSFNIALIHGKSADKIIRRSVYYEVRSLGYQMTRM